MSVINSIQVSGVTYSISGSGGGISSAECQTMIDNSISGKVNTSTITSSITSSSTDSEIPTAKAVYDAIPTGSTSGTPTVELTQAQYDALVTAGTVSPNTFYIITDAVGANITSAVTNGSTDLVTSGGVYQQVGGLKLIKMTSQEYAAISGSADSNTVYIIKD